MIRATVGTLLLLSLPAIATAQTKTELGASLASANAGVGSGSGNTNGFGIPSATLGLTSPGVYWSVFVAPRLAVGPQLGLVVLSQADNTEHFVHAAGQLDYFLRDTSHSAPYLLGSVGVLHGSGFTTAAAALSGGAGYRALIGTRLTMRFDGRFTRLTQGLGSAVTFAVSLGGVFGGQ